MNKVVEYFLRIGLAFAFLYPPYSALMEPSSWIGFFPQFMRDIAGNDTVLLHLFGAVEVIIALWLLFGKNIFIPSSIAALMLLGIVVFNWGAMEILFRDLSIFAMAVALAIQHSRSYDRSLFLGRFYGTGNTLMPPSL